uniref:Uncharacterized protein n=1 Tax=Poecilia formosa TaxID=48698 RepID=A0A096MFF7_POEFO
TVSASASRTMKGLFLICTLVSLVGFTNSLVDKGQLAELTETYQQMKEVLEKLMDERRLINDRLSELITTFINVIDPTTALVKKFAAEYFGDFLPVEVLMKKMKDIMVEAKSAIDKTNDDFGIKMVKLQQRMKKNEILINFLEEQQAEL